LYVGKLFNLHINTLTLYDSYEDFGLGEILNEIEIFYYDRISSTLYATDEQIEGLNEWYMKAISKVKEFNLNKEKEELKKRLEILEKEMN
jgi:hypothetical protein